MSASGRKRTFRPRHASLFGLVQRPYHALGRLAASSQFVEPINKLQAAVEVAARAQLRVNLGAGR